VNRIEEIDGVVTDLGVEVPAGQRRIAPVNDIN